MFIEGDVVELKRQVRLLQAKHEALLKALRRLGVLDETALRELEDSVGQAMRSRPDSK
tara:strand:+ start:468 stop:641 length:174 start_codon:yes stop_codon:yes gene_type:complete